jgi:hypothetical protein
MSRTEKLVLGAYAVWTGLVLTVCLLRDGINADNFTRLLVVGYLAIQLGWYWRTRNLQRPANGLAFVLTCTAHALAVEFFYMFSRPVFGSLRITWETPLAQALLNTLIDWAFTFPVYLAIFAIVWQLVARWNYGAAEYALVFSLGQALGDGNAFFLANPAMLLFVPYVMLNYQAINVVPYLRRRGQLPDRPSPRILKCVVPLLLIPGLYWVLGACIILVGRRFGLA